MAANPFDLSKPGLFDIYNDSSAAVPRGIVPSLPGGACNFVDLSPGASGSRCGCRRFWIRSSVGSPAVDGRGWCMCNHHACFHEDGHHGGNVYGMRDPGQENEKPRRSREPLSPVVDLSLKMPPPPMDGNDLPIFPVDDALSFIYNDPGNHVLEPTHPQRSTAQPPPGSLPDTLAWGDTPRSQAPSNKLPMNPSQGPVPSQVTSTTSSVRARYLRPFAGKGLQTLEAPVESKPQTQPQVQLGNPGSADGSFVLLNHDGNDIQSSQPGGYTQAEPRASSHPVPDQALKNLSETLSAHEHRLDRLETVSFSAGGHDECQEKQDHLDLRITDLEGRMEEVEKINHDQGTTRLRLADKNDDGTTQSVSSFSTADTSRPSHSQEIYSQLQSLQAQVASLQSALPSYSHPWHMEVVFLPFPLKKVWQDVTLFKSDSPLEEDGWTQLPMTCSSRTLRAQSPFSGEWVSPDHGAEWLLPRACGDQSTVDKRLRSRGLVKKVSVTGGDARSVQIAINSVFGDVWQDMHMPTRLQSTDARLAKFMGLQSRWVPLRKIHKDSRLRFLSPAEVLNPTAWDVQFLNSVMMRSSEPRLFVTHPDAYLQDLHAFEAGWTWQKVRELSRVYPGVSESQEVPEADALEECWSWNQQLDEPPSVANSTRPPDETKRSSTSSASQQLVGMGQTWRSSSPAVSGRGVAGMVMDRRGSRLPHIRTASVPASVAGHPSPALSRRRVVSHGQSRRSSPSVRGTPQFAVMKRRHTRSPSYSRHTPRWTASPSPMPMGLSDRQHVRGSTPFAYATPFSNAPLQEVQAVRGNSAAPFPFDYMADAGHIPDELFEIEIYESDSGESLGNEDDEDEDDDKTNEILTDAQNVHADPESHMQPNRQLPEDEPWPGIEDQQHLSDGENIDPTEMADWVSDISSQPSEYPSTHRPLPEDFGAGFHIHEDDDGPG